MSDDRIANGQDHLPRHLSSTSQTARTFVRSPPQWNMSQLGEEINVAAGDQEAAPFCSSRSEAQRILSAVVEQRKTAVERRKRRIAKCRRAIADRLECGVPLLAMPRIGRPATERQFIVE